VIWFNVHDALDRVRQWSTIADIGDCDSPYLVIDLRGIPRSFRKDDQDRALTEGLTAGPWVTIGIVDDTLDPTFAPLADAFDVLIGDNTKSEAAVDVVDVDAAVAELCIAIEASPRASVALAQLLRTSHDLSVPQALHAESLTYGLLQTSEHYRSWLNARSAPEQAALNSSDAVLTERVGSLLRVTLNRPDQRNALDIAMRDQLTEALELLDLDKMIDGAVLAGTGRNFCAGGDLTEFGTTPSPAAGHHVRLVRSLPHLMHRVRARLRVQVHGACVGAGIELPAFANAVIAHPDASFRLPEIAFGLVPGAGGTVSISRRCGRHRMAWLALTGTTIDAEQALRWRLIDRIDATIEPARLPNA